MKPPPADGLKATRAGVGTFRFKSDLRNHRAIVQARLRNHRAVVQPRLYDCSMVTQITLSSLQVLRRRLWLALQ
jgi:hypothetical protein